MVAHPPAFSMEFNPDKTQITLTLAAEVPWGALLAAACLPGRKRRRRKSRKGTAPAAICRAMQSLRLQPCGGFRHAPRPALPLSTLRPSPSFEKQSQEAKQSRRAEGRPTTERLTKTIVSSIAEHGRMQDAKDKPSDAPAKL